MPTPSGHDFQYKIEERVRAKGWETFPEESYIDDVELKPRDNDFIAIIKAVSTNPRGNQLALVVECKYLPDNVDVYVRQNPNDEDAYFMDGYNRAELFIDESKFHYFGPADVVTNVVKDSKVKDNLGSALIQAIKALLYFRSPGKKLHSKGLFFPVVVYGGPGKIQDQHGNELKSFLYYRPYEWKEPYSENRPVNRRMYVDVVHESELEHYLENVYAQEGNVVLGYLMFKEAMARKNNAKRNNPAR